jgi:hypothetical protein
MSFMPGSERWQRFPVVSLNQDTQASRDARELYHDLRCLCEGYDLTADRMGRALAALARDWPALVREHSRGAKGRT